MQNGEPLAAELHSAEETLKETLTEACSTDVDEADTGQLIKVEEMLAIASDAAKRAISIRRRQKHGPVAPSRKSVSRSAPAATATDAAATDTTLSEAVELAGAEHRHFTDAEGVEWLVRAVHPAERTDVRHARLLGTFQQGWLAFECEGAKRRLSPIPDGWEELDDVALQALCMQADLAPRRDDRAR